MEHPIHLKTWRLPSANPAPIWFPKSLTHLLQHAMDGQENPVVTIYEWKFYEINNYIFLTGHVYSPFAFPYSKKLFGSYSPEDQKLIREVALKTGIRGRKIAIASLMHLQHKELASAFSLIQSLLKPGGRFLFSVPLTRPDLTESGYDPMGRYFLLLPEEEWTRQLRTAGFQNIRTHSNADGMGRDSITWLTCIAEK